MKICARCRLKLKLKDERAARRESCRINSSMGQMDFRYRQMQVGR